MLDNDFERMGPDEFWAGLFAWGRIALLSGFVPTFSVEYHPPMNETPEKYDDFSLDQLQNLLKHHESIENFEVCAKIRDKIAEKQ